ncbi:MAG TPA: GNAT family N-acetyltransferase [Dehalococcoidia bacterium]|nr:GNAT family N-acetyltransferase [Dehalococcoidia bacterium]
MTDLQIHDEVFDQVRGEWAGLLAQVASPVPFVTPAFQRVWLDHFQEGRELKVLTAREGERLIGVAPLLIDGDRAELVGHYSICDYMDVVVTPGFEQPFMASLLGRLADNGVRGIEMRGIRQFSPTLDAIGHGASSCGFACEREDEALSPSVELPGSWEEYLGRLSKKDRHEMRRKLRRLDSGGDVELRVITEPDAASEQLDTLFKLMRISSHHKEEFLDRPGMEAFFRAVVPAMAREGMLRFYVLTLDALPVACVLNFDLGRVLYMYNSGYDPEYAHYGVGLMSKALLIREAIESGRSCVDFMRGDEAYKYDLGGTDQQVYRLLLTR